MNSVVWVRQISKHNFSVVVGTFIGEFAGTEVIVGDCPASQDSLRRLWPEKVLMKTKPN